MVDPLGLNSCNFNIALVNLTGQDSSGVESQIEALFAASSAGQPNSVGVNFQFSGNAALTVYITNNGNPGEPGGYCGTGGPCEVFASAIPWYVLNPYFDRILGVGTTHEIAHGFGLGHTDFEDVGATLMSVWTNPDYNVPARSPLYSSDFPAGLLFTPDEIKKLFKLCSKDVKKGKASFGGSGGGGTRSFGAGAAGGGWVPFEVCGCSSEGCGCGPLLWIWLGGFPVKRPEVPPKKG